MQNEDIERILRTAVDNAMREIEQLTGTGGPVSKGAPDGRWQQILTSIQQDQKLAAAVIEFLVAEVKMALPTVIKSVNTIDAYHEQKSNYTGRTRLLGAVYDSVSPEEFERFAEVIRDAKAMAARNSQ